MTLYRFVQAGQSNYQARVLRTSRKLYYFTSEIRYSIIFPRRGFQANQENDRQLAEIGQYRGGRAVRN
jgi:hypothetical protein